MKKYNKPELNVVLLQVADIMAFSNYDNIGYDDSFTYVEGNGFN